MRLPTWVGTLVAACTLGCVGDEPDMELADRTAASDVAGQTPVERPTATVVDWSTVTPPPDAPAVLTGVSVDPRAEEMDRTEETDREADGGMGDGLPEVLPVPEADFGLVCGAITCRAVAEPAAQCCTASDDVSAQRARVEAVCGVAAPDRPGCYELEQLGLFDTDCPSQPLPEEPTKSLPGCCMDSGRCGVFEADFGIGCRGHPAVSQSCGESDAPQPESEGEDGEEVSPEPATGMDADVEAPSSVCDLPGIYGARVAIDVAYEDRTPVLRELASGRGTVEILLRGVVPEVQEDGTFVAQFQTCALEVPVLRSPLLCESFHFVFEPSTFERATMPSYEVPGRMTCGWPGCRLSFSPTTAMIGISLDNVDGPWPDVGEAPEVSCPTGEGLQDCFPDHDGDGQPGLTVRLETSGRAPDPSGRCMDGYRRSGVPLAPDLAVLVQGGIRSDEMALAMRVRIGGTSRLQEQCAAEGQAVADFVNSRAVACTREEGTSNLRGEIAGSSDPCTEAELNYLDMNMPVYEVLQFGEQPTLASLPEEDREVSPGPRLQWRRLGDLDATVTCGDVRERFAAQETNR